MDVYQVANKSRTSILHMQDEITKLIHENKKNIYNTEL